MPTKNMPAQHDALVLQDVVAVDMGDKKPLLATDLKLMGHVNVTLTAEIGHVDIRLSSLFSTKAGDVLPMRESVDTPLTLCLNGKAVARGKLVAVDDNFGIQISEIL